MAAPMTTAMPAIFLGHDQCLSSSIRPSMADMAMIWRITDSTIMSPRITIHTIHFGRRSRFQRLME